MKKQAIAFFTMFSLILMLSIYYITLPNESANMSKKDVPVISDLNKDSDENKKVEKESNDDIISDPNADEKTKNEAIIKNETLKESEKLETTLMSKLKELGNDTSIEVKEKTIYINVEAKEEQSIAASIMKEVYKEVGNKYFIEVSFNSK